jgi:autophagy-related protein 33
VSIPSIMALPHPAAASTALSATTTRSRLTGLTTFTSAAFLAAFALSPRALRHPYLLYVSLMTFAGSFAGDLVPHVPRQLMCLVTATNPSPPRPLAVPAAKRYTPPGSSAGSSSAHMEQSYEMLGDIHSGSDDEGAASTSAATTAPEDGGGSSSNNAAAAADADAAAVRMHQKLERSQEEFALRTFFNMLGLSMAIVGLWGDGIVQMVNSAETYVFEL